AIDDTAELPSLSGDTAATQKRDDEDTLTGLDAVPAVQTSVARPVPTGLAQARPPRRKRRLSLRWALAITFVVLAAAAGAAVYGLSRANFVGADRNGYVAVYQGVPWDLP